MAPMAPTDSGRSALRISLTAWVFLGLLLSLPAAAKKNEPGPGSVSPGEANLFAACVASTTFEALARKDDFPGDSMRWVEDALLCDGFVDKRPNPCANSFFQLSSRCEELFFIVPVYVHAVRGDCSQAFGGSGSVRPLKACQLYAERLRSKQFSGMCEAIGQQVKGDKLTTCRRDILVIQGPEACNAIEDPGQRYYCRDSAGLLRGLAAGSKAECGSSRLCDAILTSSCGALRKTSVEYYCKVTAKTDYAAQTAKAAKEAQDKAAAKAKAEKEIRAANAARLAGEAPALTATVAARREKEMREARAANAAKTAKDIHDATAAILAARAVQEAKLAKVARVGREEQFRKANELPAYKPGDPFLNELSQEKRARYVRNTHHSRKTGAQPAKAEDAGADDRPGEPQQGQ